MPSPATTAGADRLLHCSPERTLVRTVDRATGKVELWKLFLRGSLTDAQREVAIGRQLQHLDVVHYLGAEVDPTTGRPCIRMELHAGVDLATLVGEEGPPTAAAACALLAPVARTLAAMHELRTVDFPAGLCHVDVKPGNLLRTSLTTLLLDFEHATPIGLSRASSGFSGGTTAFAPPEAFAGAPPDGAFDVFGLGATLRWLLTADSRSSRDLRGHDPGLRALIDACTHERPAARPTMGLVATELRDLAARLGADPAEPVLQAILAGDRQRAAALLAIGPPAPDRAQALADLARRRDGLLQRRPAALDLPVGIPADPAGLTAALTATRNRLRRWPRHPALLQRRLQLQRTACLLFAETLPKVTDLLREEAFDDAGTWLRAAIGLLDTSRALPGSHRIPGDDDPRVPGPLQRAPRQVLEQQLQLVARTRAECAALDETLAQAEGRLDLAAAEATIDQLAARTGGTTNQVARRRDRLHRLGFYLERVARAGSNVDRLGELERQGDLGELRRLVQACAAPPRSTASEPGGAPGLRSLQLTLTNLIEEFPQVEPRVRGALATLGSALTLATDEAWESLAAAAQKLQAVPVPVRPLQSMLGRLDSFRLIEAFIDQPDRPRSLLLDRIESLRLKLDQARATRDRLARGAELALSRGHWTTGLFDMERAVAGIGSTDDSEAESQKLRERLAEARRRKQEVEVAQRRNVELASRYAAQQDDPDGSFAERLATLRERRDCLQFLCMHAANERRQAYDHDLRSVETQLAAETADEAQVRFDHAEDPLACLRIAQQTLAMLAQQSHAVESGSDVPGRLARLLGHWHQLAAQAQREIDRRQAEQLAAIRRRRRRIAAAVVGAVLLVTTIGLATRTFFGTQAQAAARLHDALPRQRTVAELRADPLAAVVDLARFAAELQGDQRTAAERLVATVRLLLERDASFAPAAWHEQHVAALSAFAASRGDGEGAVMGRFASECWRTGLVLATSPGDRNAARELFDLVEKARPGLARSGVELTVGFEAVVE